MRNYKIDILRGVSILLVLIHHFNIPYKLHDTFLSIPIGGELKYIDCTKQQLWCDHVFCHFRFFDYSAYLAAQWIFGAD